MNPVEKLKFVGLPQFKPTYLTRGMMIRSNNSQFKNSIQSNPETAKLSKIFRPWM